MKLRFFAIVCFLILSQSLFIIDSPSRLDNQLQISKDIILGQGDSWLSGWSYRRSLIVNGSENAGTNYQIRIAVHHLAGTNSGYRVFLENKCQPDFRDIRFTDDDGVSLLDYWIEYLEVNVVARVWVEVADDLSENRLIYIYYGNKMVSTIDDGFSTFPIFDDFNRPNSTLVGNGWIEDEGDGVGSLDIESSTLRVHQFENYYCHIERSISSVSEFVIRGKINSHVGEPQSWKNSIYVYWDPYNWQGIGLWAHSENTFVSSIMIEGVSSSVSGGARYGGVWYHYRIRVSESLISADYSYDGINWNELSPLSRPSSWDGVPSLVVVGKGYSSSAYANPDLDNNYDVGGTERTSYIDDVFIRKFLENEPFPLLWNAEEIYHTPHQSITPTTSNTTSETTTENIIELLDIWFWISILISAGSFLVIVVFAYLIFRNRFKKWSANQYNDSKYVSLFNQVAVG